MNPPASVAGERPPNRLARETSPYLQQHAHNPVDWYPWGEEALARARALDRPIFLSVGYSSCHWCHVMERESFENPEIAAIMNDHFVSIKVDREERPDLDAVYMAAVQMLTGSGGWPMSVFLTPDLRPFWGGTYFPPRGAHGRPGFAEVLLAVAKIWRENRGKVDATAGELAGELARGEAFRGGEDLPGKEALDEAARWSLRAFDPRHGGFGPAPKFPRSVEISMLLRVHRSGGDRQLLAACEKTLEGMASGGMYDQIGGGFHRYSTDARWLVPHFEKMLYDNALLARAYLEAYQATGKAFYRQVVEEVLAYLAREMTSPQGGFYSATDADSEGEEGRFFVWTPEEVQASLGEELGRIACECYGITAEGNFEGGRSIPHRAKSIEEAARALDLGAERVRAGLAEARRRLYEERGRREKPFRDEKVITAWNALAVSAFARAYQVLEAEAHREAAVRAADFLLENLRPGGRLHRTFKDGRSRFPGYLDDHAYLAEALVDLYEATFERRYLDAAVELAETLLRDFRDAGAGGFFFTASFHEELICRKKDQFDNATPSGSGVAALTLLRLERLTGRRELRERAGDVLRSVAPLLERAPMAFGSTLIALDFLLHPPVEVVVIGEPRAERTRALLRAVHGRFLPDKVLAGSAGPVPAGAAAALPLLEGKEAPGGQPTAYVCRDFTCRPPVTAPADLEKLLGESG